MEISPLVNNVVILEGSLEGLKTELPAASWQNSPSGDPEKARKLVHVIRSTLGMGQNMCVFSVFNSGLTIHSYQLLWPEH